MENKQILSLAFIDGENKYSLDTTNAVTITRAGAPTQATIGKIGQFYMDTNTGNLYKCISVTATAYNWELETRIVQYSIDETTDNISNSSISSFDELYRLITDKRQYPYIIFQQGTTYMPLFIASITEEEIKFKYEKGFVLLKKSDDTIRAEDKTQIYQEDLVQDNENFETVNNNPPSALAINNYITKRLSDEKTLIDFTYNNDTQKWSPSLSYNDFYDLYINNKKLCIAHLINSDSETHTTDITYIPDYFIITSSLGKLKWDDNDQITELQNSDLPQYTDADNGKILTLVEGVPTWQANTISEEISNTLDTILVKQQEVIYS